MDQVSYQPGSPNVLSMTKRVSGELAEGARGESRPARPDDDGLVRCSRADDGDETVLAIGGVLDTLTAVDVGAVLDAIVSERRASVTVDLSALRRVDGSGIASVVRLSTRCKEFGGAVRVTGLKDQPLAVFKLLRLDRFLQLS